MYTISVRYKNKQFTYFEHISKVIYNNLIEDIVVEGSDIQNHVFPTNHDLHLFSDEGSEIIKANNLIEMTILKED